MRIDIRPVDQVNFVTHILYCLLLVTLLLSGCGWVDATGQQSDNPNFSDDRNAILLADGGTVYLQEQTPRTQLLTGQDSQFSNWQWQPTHRFVDRNSCAQRLGVRLEQLAATIESACTSDTQCRLQINENTIDGRTQFSVRIPQLRAPFAQSFRLSTISETGEPVQREHQLCAASINEAPLAQDDHYIVIREATRFIRTSDPNDLIDNDSDDDDISNIGLRILPDQVQGPRFADQFTLGADGSFTYRASEQAPVGSDGSISDSFTYLLTDGTHSVRATVSLLIVEENQQPSRLRPIPDFIFSIEDNPTEKISIDLSDFFTDRDDDALIFSVAADSLPASGNLRLTTTGELTGDISAVDIGEYRVTVFASDGIERASDTFRLSINQFSSPNLPPIVIDIANRIVQNRFSYDVSIFFIDPDGDELSFSADGLPDNTRINRQGVISGTATPNNRGAWFIVVEADDGHDGQTSDGFRLLIN